MVINFKKAISISSAGIVILITISFVQLWLLVSWVGKLIFYSTPKQQAQIVTTNTDIKKYENSLPCDTSISDLSIIKDGLVPTRITIDKLNIDLPVVSQKFTNSKTAVNKYSANFDEATSLINGTKGNTVIYGADRSQVFSSIKEVQIGNKIEIYAKNYKIIYEVESVSALSSKKKVVFSQTDKPTLTLVVSDGDLSKLTYNVQAKFNEISKLSCND
jgi:LPXTG-site transpeptidase (sortase) family protein